MSEPTAFHDLDAYVALPRIGGLALSPDGRRLVTAVGELDPKRTRYDHRAVGGRPGRRAPGAAADPQRRGRVGAAFMPDGALLFASARPGPAGGRERGADEARAVAAARRRRRGPRRGHPARRRERRRGGRQSRHGGAELGHPAVVGTAEDDAKTPPRRARTAKVSRSCTSATRSGSGTTTSGRTGRGCWSPARCGTTPTPAPVTRRSSCATSPGTPAGRWTTSVAGTSTPDGRTVVAALERRRGRRLQRYTLVAIDVATGERSTLLADAGPRVRARRAVSPDGTRVAVVVQTRSSPTTRATCGSPCVAARRRAGAAHLAGDWDRWPARRAWTPDGSALVVAADDDGRARCSGSTPDRQCHPADRRRRRLHRRRVSPGRRARLRAARGRGRPARARSGSTPRAPDQQPVPLPGPAPAAGAARAAERGHRHRRGRHAAARMAGAAGERVGAAARAAAAVDPRRPAGSWNAWSWRWNPWLRPPRRVRRPAAGPGAVDRLRAGLHPPGLGPLGCTSRTPT